MWSHLLLLVAGISLFLHHFIGIVATIRISGCFFLYFFFTPKRLFFASIFWVSFFPFYIRDEVAIRTKVLASSSQPDYVACMPENLIGLKQGDAIEFEQSSYTGDNWYISNLLRTYTHWGIYLGANTVLHLNNLGNGSAEVQQDEFDTPGILAYGKCRINNLHKFGKRGSIYEIFARQKAFTAQGKHLIYDKLKSNCEHFVTYCLFLEEFSTQATNSFEYLENKFITNFLILYGVYIGIYLIYTTSPNVRNLVQNPRIIAIAERALVLLRYSTVFVNSQSRIGWIMDFTFKSVVVAIIFCWWCGLFDDIYAE